MITDSHLNVVRKVLEGQMSHAELMDAGASKFTLNAQHRACVAMTMLLIHAEQACCHDGKDLLLHRPGLEQTYGLLLGKNAQVTLNASTQLGLHRSLSSQGTWLTPPPALLTIAKGFTPSSPSVVAFMRTARRMAEKNGLEWLPWYVEVDETPSAQKADAFLIEHRRLLADPSFALAVLAQLHGDEPARVAAEINGLPQEVRAAIVKLLSLKINPYLT